MRGGVDQEEGTGNCAEERSRRRRREICSADEGVRARPRRRRGSGRAGGNAGTGFGCGEVGE
jgi:hypothetical protein